MTVRLVNRADDNSQTFDSRKEAEETKQDMMRLGVPEGDLEIVMDASDGRQETDGGTTVVEDQTQQEPAQPPEKADLPDQQPGVDTDPLNWVPSDFVDTIDGKQAINRKGYDVLAHHYGISVTTQVLVSPSETDFEYAEVVATAETSDGVEYTAHGSAHVDRGDDSYLLLEMADTRSAKRATARATGVGMVAVSELQNEL